MKAKQIQPTTSLITTDMNTEGLDKSLKHFPFNLTRRKSSIEKLKVEEARADDQANIHWSTKVMHPGEFKRRSSDKGLAMRDSIIDFKDQDGK
jgi:hypothetical protein